MSLFLRTLGYGALVIYGFGFVGIAIGLVIVWGAP